MKKIMQFRYYNYNNPKNYPKYSDYDQILTRGNIFSDYKLVSHLGIQGPPGLKFYLNNSNNSISIGKTGIYELDLEHLGRIFSIRFDANDLKALVSDQDDVRLLIDIVYDGG